MYVHRSLSDYFNRDARKFPIVMITGARQVGKTTFLKKQSEPERKYVSLDDPVVRALANEDPSVKSPK